MPMAAKLSDLADEMSGANLQMEAHADVPAQSVKDLGSWKYQIVLPPAHHIGLLPGGHCLVTLKWKGRVGGDTHTLSFLDSPLEEDMLRNARTGLTEAVVTGPGRAVLFYGRHSMGEGLTDRWG